MAAALPKLASSNELAANPEAASANTIGTGDGGSGFIDYSKRDHEIVDYQFYSLPELPGIKFRGPRPRIEPGNYFSCIGASQTMGVLVDRPFPTLLGDKLNLPALNLGLGGARPGFYGNSKALMDYANNSRFLILQIMSARGEQNDRFTPSTKVEHVIDKRQGDEISTMVAWDRALKEEPEKIPLYAAQSRNAWERGYLDIISKVNVPVILFWFADKDPNEPIHLSADSGIEMLGRFPQLVDSHSLATIKQLCDAFVTCDSNRNRGHPYRSRFDGSPVEIDYSLLGFEGIALRESHNHYYHTQEMHEDAVPELLKAIQQLGLTNTLK